MTVEMASTYSIYLYITIADSNTGFGVIESEEKA